MEKTGVAKIVFAGKNRFFARIYFCITVKCCYTVYNVLTDDWHTDNVSTAVKRSDVNDGATMQPQNSSI